jgi:hypothetical protein
MDILRVAAGCQFIYELSEIAMWHGGHNKGGLTFCMYSEVKDFYVQSSGVN